MRSATIEYILRQLGSGKTKPSGEGWLMAHCPLAPTRHETGQDKHPSLGIKVGPGPSYVKCHACGIGGDIKWLIRATRKDGLCTDEQAERAMVKVTWSARYEPKPEEEVDPPQPLLDQDVIDQLDRGHRYFERRRFSEREVREWRLGYLTGGRAILLPCVLKDGHIPYVQARTYKGDKMFWWIPEGIKRYHVGGSHLLHGREQRLIVTEGIFDAMRVRRMLRKHELLEEYGVVATFGSKPNRDTLDHALSFATRELIMCPDRDEAGDLFAELMEDVGRRRVAVITRMRLPKGIKDPDEAGTSALIRALRDRRNVLVSRMRALLHHDV